jgi:hypothetical protein
MDSSLKQAVEAFLQETATLPDSALERPWAWREYDEGIRLAFFRTFEELQGLAVVIANRRERSQSPTSAQRILAQFHRAYRDLEAVLLGVGDDLGGQLPAEGEWPVKIVVAHIIGTERQFYGRIHYAVERQRSGDNRPLEMPQADLEAFVGLHLNRDVLEPLPLSAIRAAQDNLHERILADLVDLSDEDLRAPSVWWEEYPYDARFRMHRFESHLRQHTIQVEKTLVALGRGPSEAKRLARLIFGGLAEVEGNLLGAPGIANDLIDDFVAELEARTAGVVAAVATGINPGRSIASA